ncbi:MAG TPA: hypothetical protein VHX42_00110 [Candidatus Babeliales bacterium]|jgi:hypothetical protein|nr:hypothetical protein [Candidatus Babeliales bacterium]
MHKTITVISLLCVAIPLIGMEMEIQKIKEKKKTEIAPLLITSEENKNFLSYVKEHLDFCNQLVVTSNISQNNPIHNILKILSGTLQEECDNDVLELVTSKELEERINNYKKKIDSHKTVKFCLQQIHKKQGDINEARDLILKNRIILAEYELRKLQPLYSYKYIGAVQNQDKIEYMKRNKDYPIDKEEAIRDFIALLLYKVIFARQID